MTGAGRIPLLAALCSLLPAVVLAQTRAPRFEISGGALYLSGQNLADTDATLTRNQIGGEDFTLFQSDTRVDAAPGFEGRVGWHLSRTVVIEGGLLWSRPRLSARLASDVEGIPDVTLEEDLSLYVFDGAVAFHLPDAAFSGGQAVPFIRAGIGYVRQLHEDNVLVETGQAYHVGGGVSMWFGPRARTGLRLDARVIVLDGAIDLGKGRRTVGAGGAALVVKF
jgi:hypothetical protein